MKKLLSDKDASFDMTHVREESDSNNVRRTQDIHLTWYSSTHKKGDSDFQRLATMRTPLIS